LFYDPGTGEITFSAKHSHGLDLDCSNITDVSNIFFCNDTCISGNIQDTLSISGDFNVNTSATGALALRVNDANNISVHVGTVAAPSVNFLGDENTGIFSQGSDKMGISTGGVLEATISSVDHLSVVAGSAAIPSINFGIAGDPNTGIYQVGADQIGFSVAGTLEAEVATTTHLSVVGGSVGNPAVNFGLTGTDENTGMYQTSTANTIAFSTDGQQKVTLIPSTGPVVVGMIHGLNVGEGTARDIPGIRRLSIAGTAATSSWEDGNCGICEHGRSGW